ncbi:hypothetical protein VQ056_00295 [Paenibacillus sp. JTLBN-2024]
MLLSSKGIINAKSPAQSLSIVKTFPLASQCPCAPSVLVIKRIGTWIGALRSFYRFGKHLGGTVDGCLLGAYFQDDFGAGQVFRERDLFGSLCQDNFASSWFATCFTGTISVLFTMTGSYPGTNIMVGSSFAYMSNDLRDDLHIVLQ